MQDDSSLPAKMPLLLRGTRILICRPEESARELALALSAMGAECLSFPTLAISETELSEADRQLVLNLDQYQHIIVTSQHAAKLGLAEIDRLWPQFPVQQNWYPIGEKTASLLQQEQLNIIHPERTLTSESLLSVTALQKVKHQKVLILKGIEGRDLLSRTLRHRGAEVDELALYQRICPDYSEKEILNALETFQANYFVTLSGETLQNLIRLSDQVDFDLAQGTFIVPSHRVANIAYQRGFKSVLIPANLKPIDLIKSITNHKKNFK